MDPKTLSAAYIADYDRLARRLQQARDVREDRQARPARLQPLRGLRGTIVRIAALLIPR